MGVHGLTAWCRLARTLKWVWLMAWSEKDDDPRNSRFEDAKSRGRRRRDDSRDKDLPDRADLAADDMETVACAQCKKLIFEDSVRCPYCKHLLLEEPRSGKPLWFIVTAILCLLLFGGYLLTRLFDLFPWFHR